MLVIVNGDIKHLQRLKYVDPDRRSPSRSTVKVIFTCKRTRRADKRHRYTPLSPYARYGRLLGINDARSLGPNSNLLTAVTGVRIDPTLLPFYVCYLNRGTWA